MYIQMEFNDKIMIFYNNKCLHYVSRLRLGYIQDI